MSPASSGSLVNETTVASDSARRKLLPRLLMVIALAALLAWLGWKGWWSLSHVATDDAQVEGNVVPLLPKVGGFLTEVKVSDHQHVKVGELLAQIDDRDYRVKLAQAETDLSLALANAGRAQKDLQRIRTLVAQKMISPQALDAAESAARAAQAQVRTNRDNAASAEEQVTASGAALRAAVARVEAARAARDLAVNQLADTRILAPLSGVVSNKSVVPGQFVQSGQSLLSVVPLDEIWVVANLKETDMNKLRVGDAAGIEVDAYAGMKLEGQVESISPATGARFSMLPPDNATGNFTKVVQRVPVRIRVRQSADAARPLRPGMSVEVVIDTGRG